MVKGAHFRPRSKTADTTGYGAEQGNLRKIKTGKEDELSSHYNNKVSSVFDYAMTAESQQEATTKGTLFGAYNSVTGYFQNVRNFRDDESKFKSIMYGTGFDRSQVAFDLCADFAKHGNDVLKLN